MRRRLPKRWQCGKKNKINTTREGGVVNGWARGRHLWDAHSEEECTQQKVQVTRICALQMYLSSSLGLAPSARFASYNSSPFGPGFVTPPRPLATRPCTRLLSWWKGKFPSIQSPKFSFFWDTPSPQTPPNFVFIFSLVFFFLSFFFWLRIACEKRKNCCRLARRRHCWLCLSL